MDFAAIFKIVTAVVQAIQLIHNSDVGKTLEQSANEVVHHLTPGSPNSPTLSGPSIVDRQVG